MIPILYSPQETAFDSNGLGMLSDVISSYVEEELNGQYELTMKYPTNGIHYADIINRSIILAKPDPVSDLQPFRVYRRVPSSAGTVTVYARHIAYDLRGITVSPFTATGAAAAMQGLKSNAVNDCPFEFKTDKDAGGTMTVDVPTAIWTQLGNSEGSVLDTFGGEYEFDKFTVNLWTRRGADRGVSIRYGKNLTSLEQDENCDNCCTGVYPYWASEDGQLIQLPEKIVNAPGTYDYTSILPLDLSEEWEEPPTEEQLRERAERYVADNDVGIPAVSWKVEFVQLEQTEEYKGKALLERVLLGDTVSVEFPAMNVSASSRAVAAKFDVLLERYDSVTLGSVKANLASTIAQQQKEIAKAPTVSLVQSVTMRMTAAILGAMGGAVRLLDTDGDKMPDTLYVADNPDPAKAVKVWRWNYEGWAGSKTGYNGPFIIGATLEDGLLASAVTAANLVAGTIVSKDNGETFFLDLDNCILRMKALDDLDEKYTSVALDVDGIIAQVFQQGGDIDGIIQRLTTIVQNINSVAIQIQSVIDNGVDQVTTQTGYTFNDEGLRITKSGQEIENLLDNTGMYVTRSGETVLQATNAGVSAVDVTVRNYLIVGTHARFEDYGTDRTACFYI